MSPSWMPISSRLLIEAGVPEGLLKPHAALVVVEVDVGHEPLEPGALHEPGAVVGALDVQRGGGVHLRRAWARTSGS